MAQDVTDLQIARAEALVALARTRLQPPERERVIGMLQAAIAAAREPGPAADADLVARAERKAAQAEADREEKRRPYEADPLFMYLWRRRYGTRDYAASNLVRFFDRKVAHLIGYEAARINYAMLIELPDRLREHAARLRASGAAGTDAAALSSLDAARRSPDVAVLLREAAAGERPEDSELLRRVRELDEALGGPHQPLVANE